MQSAFTWLKGDMVMWRVWLLEAWSSGAVGVVAGVGVGIVQASAPVLMRNDLDGEDSPPSSPSPEAGQRVLVAASAPSLNDKL